MYPNRPAIRKIGTIDCDIIETTPFVFQNDLYRFEYFRPMHGRGLRTLNVKNAKEHSYFRIIQVRTNTVITEFAQNYHLGSAFVDGDTVYAVGITPGVETDWGGDTICFFRSKDLQNWEQYAQLHLPGWMIYNTGVCKLNGTYTLLMEIAAPVEERGPFPFTFRFAQSKDMTNWVMTPWECAFQRDRYAGAPAIYSLENDPHYYVFYLEEYPNEHYATCIARSKDLIHWEYSPINPVLMYDDIGDKQIASHFLTPSERERIRVARNVNDSDMELCEFMGRTILYYSWGDQHGTEFLAEACFEGSMKELLTGFFPNNQ